MINYYILKAMTLEPRARVAIAKNARAQHYRHRIPLTWRELRRGKGWGMPSLALTPSLGATMKTQTTDNFNLTPHQELECQLDDARAELRHLEGDIEYAVAMHDRDNLGAMNHKAGTLRFLIRHLKGKLEKD